MEKEKMNEYMLTQTQLTINLCPSEVKEKLSDGFHSFEELYKKINILENELKNNS